MRMSLESVRLDPESVQLDPESTETIVEWTQISTKRYPTDLITGALNYIWQNDENGSSGSGR